MKNIYLITGLGADRRLFKKIKISGFKINYIEWTTPNKDDSFSSYLERYVPQIKQGSILIGVSLGGMAAIELSKKVEVDKVILISSVKSRGEMPLYLRFIGRFKIYKMAPIVSLKRFGTLGMYVNGVSSKEARDALLEMIDDVDNVFYIWAAGQAANWSNLELIPNLTQIHGSNDKIFPIKNIDPDFIINDGTHFMVYEKGEEISEIIKEQIEEFAV